jgi:hypothetical protein
MATRGPAHFVKMAIFLASWSASFCEQGIKQESENETKMVQAGKLWKTLMLDTKVCIEIHTTCNSFSITNDGNQLVSIL